MPWFKIDDKAHSHPKVIKAGNAALGLWLRCGSYAAQHLTEGIVPGVVAQLYGTTPQAAKLVKAGLWHERGHDCAHGCPDPDPGDYVIHDFLEDGRNTSRARHEADKKKARERQAKHREGAESEGSEQKMPPKTDRFADESSSKKSESASGKIDSHDSDAGQGHESRRDKNVTGIHAATAPYPSTSYGSTAAAASAPEIRSYDTLGDLKRAIATAGLTGFSWNLQASQIERARQVRESVGLEAMVTLAVNNVRLKGLPASASAWLADWESLKAGPEGVANLPVAVGSGLRSVPNAPTSHNAGVLARRRARREQP